MPPATRRHGHRHIVLALLAAVLVGDWINRFVPILPPIVQIALGVALAVGPVPSVEFEPHIFFLVFVPPLLFLDGWRIPKRDLLRDSGVVLALALGLVVFTVAGIGTFIHWLIPAMPLSVAFALAAVLSPTDPIAVPAVAANAPVPRRLMHILEGEALLNDATSLFSGSEEARMHNRAVLKIERRLRLAGLAAERDALFKLRRGRAIEDSLLRRLVRELDLLETRCGG